MAPPPETRAIDRTRRRPATGVRPRAAALALLLLAGPAGAGSPDDLEAGERGRVVATIDGDTVALESGLEVRLTGIQAPKLALGRPGFVEWPLAGESRDALAALVQDREVALRYGGRRRDRHRRALAHMVRGDGLWVQRAMISIGMARVYSFADNRALVPELLAAERAARAARRGLWAHPWYRVRGAGALDRDVDTFQVVEDRVLAAEVVRGRVYLNFGADWRADFTITVAPRDRRMFEEAWAAAGVESVAALAGRRVRARGWIDLYNGPQIVADHPEQIEFAADPPDAGGPEGR